jgi:hypothetical protein
MQGGFFLIGQFLCYYILRTFSFEDFTTAQSSLADENKERIKGGLSRDH